MKRIYTTFLLAFLFSHTTIAQTSPMYSWDSGSNLFNPVANYGTLGTFSSSSIPGGKENSMSWIDNSNNLWLFGGHGYNASTTQGYCNDLWKYNTSTNQWAWISGSTTLNQHGTYGTKGVAAATNIPGARQNAYTWKDNSGNFWLFGGNGYAAAGGLGYLNDLWKYDLSSNQWTWVSGSNVTNQAAVYGTINIAAVSNIPSGRFGGSFWIDGSNQLWLFGGQQFTTAIERTNDLWKYDITTNQWTWISGANTPDQNGVYGTKGISSPSNIPGARQASVSWTDIAGNFWLFAGYGFPATGAHSYLNDLWKFDIITKEWTWISGSDLTNQAAVYGTLGTPSASTIPGARQMSISWRDSSNKFWLFGGWGYIGPPFGRLNDLWNFNPSTNQWTWISGANVANQQGTYGTLGTASTSNIPGARRMSISWKDNTEKLWLYGGNGYDDIDSLGLMNDLWSIDLGLTSSVYSTDKNEFEISVTPNPSSDYILIKMSDNKNHKIEIFDSIGNLIHSELMNNTQIIPINNFKNGLYLIRVDNNYIRRFIKM